MTIQIDINNPFYANAIARFAGAHRRQPLHVEPANLWIEALGEDVQMMALLLGVSNEHDRALTIVHDAARSALSLCSSTKMSVMGHYDATVDAARKVIVCVDDGVCSEWRVAMTDTVNPALTTKLYAAKALGFEWAPGKPGQQGSIRGAQGSRCEAASVWADREDAYDNINMVLWLKATIGCNHVEHNTNDRDCPCGAADGLSNAIWFDTSNQITATVRDVIVKAMA